METRANYLLVGIVALIGFIGMMLFLMWFAKVELDREFDYYDAYFTGVSGLSPASEVRFAGLGVGQVLDMRLAEDGSARVRVRLEVRQDTPIRANSRATLETQGVTGVAYIGISPGTSDAPMLRDDSSKAVPVIQSSSSALQTLSDQGPEIISRLNTVSEQLTQLLGEENQTRVEHILTNIENSSDNLDQAIDDISAATGAIAKTAERIADFGDHLDGLSDAAIATLDKADGALERFSKAADTADTTLATATDTMDELRSYVTGDLTQLTGNLDTAATDVSNLSRRIHGSMEGVDSVLAASRRTIDAADRILNTDISPTLNDLRRGMTRFTDSIGRISDDIPQITDHLRDAADKARDAFATLQDTIEGARGPVQSFSRDGLVQFTNVAREARDLVDNLNQLVTALRRNPSQVITGPREPEFRR